MDIFTVLVHLHSLSRWILLIFIIATIVLAFRKNSKDQASAGSFLKPAMWSMAAAHLQLILGLILYLISPKVIFSGGSMKEPMLRFFLVEHILLMLMAIALITLGYIRAKKAANPSKQRSGILLYFIIALILILTRIPWPFLGYGGKWI